MSLVNKGASKTLHSKHIKGLAIDFVVYHEKEKRYSWDEEDLYWYKFLGALVKDKIGHKVTWGGDWEGFRDYVHFELKDDAE
jgi:peptidoglycan L-alanyl-D-glutamate endopeptidase CwlK